MAACHGDNKSRGVERFLSPTPLRLNLAAKIARLFLGQGHSDTGMLMTSMTVWFIKVGRLLSLLLTITVSI